MSNSKPAKAKDVARFIVDYQHEDPNFDDVSHLKLQKLLFYCQAFHLALDKGPLFKEKVVAWPYGPVVVEVYNEYAKYHNSIIPPNEKSEQTQAYGLDEEQTSTVSGVLRSYGHLAAVALMEQTHRQEPWQEAFRKGTGTAISTESMTSFYKDFIDS